MISFINTKSAAIFSKIPESVTLFIARFAIAAVFWRSGQTKIQGFSLDIITMKAEFGLPQLADSTLYLFQHEYTMIAAILATIAEHVLPILILTGTFTRLAGFGIAMMTLVIQIFVYPDAYPTHATWIAISLLLMYRGAGNLSVDHWLTKR